MAGSNRLGALTKVPITALLRFDNARAGLNKGKIQGRIEVYATDQTSTVTIDGHKQPMESDSTAAFAYQLNDSPIYGMEIAGFFNSSVFDSDLIPKDRAQDGIFTLQPYRLRRVGTWHRIVFVKRVVFISTPQHGAMLAASQFATGLASKLVRLPLTMVNTTW